MRSLKQTALNYKKIMKMNVLPLKGKRPMIVWDKWQNEIQTENDISKWNWGNATGLGGIQGINDYRCLDFDGIEDYEIIEMILKDLKLPGNYPWVVQSGSGKGFHIHLRSTNPGPPQQQDKQKSGEAIFEKIGGEKAVYKFKMKKTSAERGEKEKVYCKHIELRWMNCQTALPPSLHESGGIYNYYYEEPTEEPAKVELEDIIKSLEKYCIIKNQDSTRQQLGLEVKNQKGKIKDEEKKKRRKTFYDKDRLESALDFLSENLPDGSYEEWYKIGFALVPLGEEGKKYFISMSLKNPGYNDTESELMKKFDSLARDYDGRVNIGTIYHTAEIYGWKKPVIKFWYRENEKLKISRIRFKKFLENEGFCKYKIDTANGTSSDHLIIRIENNIVEEIDPIDVKEYMLNYIERMPTEELEGTNRNEIIEVLIKAAHNLFTQHYLEFLITRNIEFNKDTYDKGFFYFKNGFVEAGLSPTPVRFYDYKKMMGHIWRKQIINRNFIPMGTEESKKRSVFEDFLFNVCRNEVKRYSALKSGIGYLLHRYKDPSIAKAIVFIDEKLSEGAFGRSGKGLVIKSIAHIRNVVIEDGRNFNPAKNFAFQRVKADTNILGFEDIRDKFPFEKLFSIITDGITIERKNKDEIHIGYTESPKVVLSTNFTVSGVDDSTIDRQFIIEFSDYYNKSHRPVHDFGKPFFGSWNEDEWSAFDNYMISCLQFYLDKGLVRYDYINLEKKKMIDETCPEFVEYAEEIYPGKDYEKKELFENFKKEYDDFEKLTQSKFTRWLKIWGRVKELEVREAKSGARRIIEFVEKKKGKM